MRRAWPAIAAAAAVAVFPLLPFVPEFWITLGNYIGLFSLVAMGLVLLTGVGGMTSFGQAAFVGIGAYATAVLSTTYGVSPWLTLPVALVVSGTTVPVLLCDPPLPPLLGAAPVLALPCAPPLPPCGLPVPLAAQEAAPAAKASENASARPRCALVEAIFEGYRRAGERGKPRSPRAPPPGCADRDHDMPARPS